VSVCVSVCVYVCVSMYVCTFFLYIYGLLHVPLRGQYYMPSSVDYKCLHISLQVI
jgi:hypothetical protein